MYRRNVNVGSNYVLQITEPPPW
uniref:Uncharacterized protein n=1 Tax=Rhizophora mucronata TaxID=61149 RepID=A0A2P2QCE4_RHIMU